MAYVIIVVDSDTGERTPSLNGYDGVADLEVQTLLQRARSIVMSLTSEVEKRKLKITEHWEVILQENFDRLLVVQELNEQDIKLLRFAHDLNEKPREKWTTQNTIYSEFLKVVGRYCNHGFALLCVLAFSQRFIVRMAKNDRINLYKFIETSNGSFSSPRLDTLAIQHDILKLFASFGTLRTAVTLPIDFVEPYTPIWVPAIKNFILMPPGKYDTFTSARSDAMILPSPILHDGMQESMRFQEERIRQTKHTSCAFLALPQNGGDALLLTLLSYRVGFGLTFNGFA